MYTFKHTENVCRLLTDIRKAFVYKDLNKSSSQRTFYEEGFRNEPLTAQKMLVLEDEQQRVERERERESSVAAMHVETLPGLASALHKVP